MRKIHRQLTRLLPLLVLLLAAGTTPLRAQSTVRFDVRTPLLVAQGQQFQIEFVVTTDAAQLGSDFTPPTFSGDLTVLSGPVKAGGTFQSNINGVVSRQTTHTYTYWVQAGAPGKITIGKASVVVEGRTYTTEQTLVECFAGDQNRGQSGADPQQGASGQQNQPGGGQAAGAQAQSQRPQAPQGQLNRDDILLRIEVNKRDVWRGEPVVASLKIYTQVNIVGFENAKYPALGGFWTQEMDVGPQGDTRETINGKVYFSHVLRQWLLYPQRTGTIEIDPAELTAVAQVIVQAAPQSNSPWDIFFSGPEVRNVPARLSTPAVRIQVKDLPRPQPENFTGAVGRFELDAVIGNDQFAANTAGSVTVRLSGTGNFPLIEAPQVQLPAAAFEQYDTKMTERLSNTARGTAGERTWEYPFIARAEGSYVIPGVSLSYFDPATGNYVELTSGDFPVEVTRDNSPSGSGGLPMVSGVTKEDLKMLGQDIRFIRIGSPGLHARDRVLVWSLAWWIVALALVIAFLVCLRLLQQMIRERADLTRVRTKKANSVALRRLKKAKGYMASGKDSAFFEEMLRALWGYMGDKLSIDVAGLTKERVRTELELRGVSDEETAEFLTLLSDCEFAQYAPGGGIRMEQVYNAALELIGRFESKI